MEDICYERRRAEACVDESAHHALANAGGREIVCLGKEEGGRRGMPHVYSPAGCSAAAHLLGEILYANSIELAR